MNAMIGNALLLGGEGYNIERSVRLRSSASAYFNRTPAGAGNRRTWTWSGWVKRGALNIDAGLFEAGTTSNLTAIYISTEKIGVQDYISGSYNLVWTTLAVFRDPSAWYHIVVAYDTTQASSANAVRIYVNGVEQAETFSAPLGAYVQNRNSFINSTSAHRIGTYNGVQNYFDGYLTEVNFIDGQALTPSSFGETNTTTGVWQPKKYAGTYGTNGFYLNFSDNSGATATTIGKDYSGNGNNWTPNNISVTAGVTYDSMLDVPTQWADGGNGRGNYCTLNPVTPFLVNTTLSQGNLVATKAAASTVPKIYGTIGVNSGKWYWEIKLAAQGGVGNYYSVIGASNNSSPSGNDSAAVFYYGTNDATLAGDKSINGVTSNYGANYVAGDTVGVALDCDNLQITFYKNGVSQGVITGLTADTYLPAFRSDGGSNNATFEANFGQRPFAYTPPTGFKALNTLNLPEPTILKGNQYFDATTYTGTGAARSVTNAGEFQPDLVWIKNRSNGTGYAHYLNDSARGVFKTLIPNLTNAEYDGTANSDGVSAFNANGFSLLSGTNVFNYNANANNYVAWQWKEGATQGFDIVTYTGTGVARTVAHNLGVAPAMMIIKSRSSAVDWLVYHAALGNPNYIVLNTTAAAATNAAAWNNTSPNSSVFTVGTGTSVNANAATYVAYLFAEVAGFSKFGSYTGNGSTNGPFVFCGFRPRFIMIKRTDSTADWHILDTARDTYNVAGNVLYPNLSAAESGVVWTDDILSNGFKIRITGTAENASGGTYIFAAFAENPFKNALAR